MPTQNPRKVPSIAEERPPIAGLVKTSQQKLQRRGLPKPSCPGTARRNCVRQYWHLLFSASDSARPSSVQGQGVNYSTVRQTVAAKVAKPVQHAKARFNYVIVHNSAVGELHGQSGLTLLCR